MPFSQSCEVLASIQTSFPLPLLSALDSGIDCQSSRKQTCNNCGNKRDCHAVHHATSGRFSKMTDTSCSDVSPNQLAAEATEPERSVSVKPVGTSRRSRSSQGNSILLDPPSPNSRTTSTSARRESRKYVRIARSPSSIPNVLAVKSTLWSAVSDASSSGS